VLRARHRYDSRIDRAITAVIHPPPRTITWLVTVVYQAGSFGVVIVVLGMALLARRRAMARDIALSAAGAAAVSGILVLLIGSRGGRPGGIVIDGYDLTFPVLRIALFAAVATAALPYLARGLQRLVEIFIALVALASAVGGHELPLNVLGSLAIGWGVTAAVRLVFGSPLGLPSANDVRRLLAELSSPRKLVLLLGGSFAGELLVAMTLSVSLRAFGDHLRLPTLIVIIALPAILAGITPSPGGIGVVEAGMILGLTAAGVSEADAIAAVFIQRLFTSYLPPIWGWFTLAWMRKREYL
jgi:uncharacterized membrane protein YbhN (UPF0104 family)